MFLGFKNEKFGCNNNMTFIADTMLGKLARWLRILGYDPVYDQAMTVSQMAEAAKKPDSVLLTRRIRFHAESLIQNTVFIPHEKFEDQLRYIVGLYNLKINGPFFTRCLKCNREVIPVAKDRARGKVPERTFEGTEEFYKCPECENIFWRGAHHKNTLNKLDRIFNPNHQV